jgi:hypothetical protein
MKKILFGALLLLCSCDDYYDTGVVTSVSRNTSAVKRTFQVQVKTSNKWVTTTHFTYYTNDTLQVGDTIHIGMR